MTQKMADRVRRLMRRLLLTGFFLTLLFAITTSAGDKK